MTTPKTPSSSPVAWSANDLAGDPHAITDKATRIRRMFAGIAPSYDLNNRLHSLGRDQAWRRRAVQEAAVRADEDVLDVACGTGDLTEAFARARPRSVVGLDFTPEMLEIARRKASERRRSDGPTPTYVEGDAMALPFESGSFDVVSIAFGLRNVSAPDRALAEFGRVLRPGGRFVMLEFGRPGSVLGVLNDLYTQRIMPLTATWIAGDRSGAYRYLPRSVATFETPDEIQAAIEAAGLAKVSIRRLTLGVCVLYHASKP